MKKLHNLDRAEKLAVLTDIAKGDIDPKLINKDTQFALDVKDWCTQERDHDPNVILCGKALEAEKTAMTIDLELVSKNWETGELITEPGRSIRVPGPGFKDEE